MAHQTLLAEISGQMFTVGTMVQIIKAGVRRGIFWPTGCKNNHLVVNCIINPFCSSPRYQTISDSMWFSLGFWLLAIRVGHSKHLRSSPIWSQYGTEGKVKSEIMLWLVSLLCLFCIFSHSLVSPFYGTKEDQWSLMFLFIILMNLMLGESP